MHFSLVSVDYTTFSRVASFEADTSTLSCFDILHEVQEIAEQ